MYTQELALDQSEDQSYRNSQELPVSAGKQPCKYNDNVKQADITISKNQVL